VLDELRDRIISYLSQNRVCIITTSGTQGAWAVLATYKNAGLDLYCRLPRWSDAVYHLEQDPRTVVIITDTQSGELRWLEYRGITLAIPSNDDRYFTVQITPERIDLIDESRGWGARETLDF
jgi:hypothetical protein